MSRFLKFIVNIVLLCSIVVAAALLVPPLAGVTTVVIDEERMETNLPKGSVTYARTKSLGDIGTGDSVLIDKGQSVYVYQVESIDTSTGTYTVKDTLSSEGDTQDITLRNKANKVVITVPFIGYVAIAMKTPEGLIMIGLGIVFVIILFVLSEIWKKDNEEDDEDDEDEEEEEVLSRKERKKMKKAEKKRRKAAKKGYADDDDEEPLFPKASARMEREQKIADSSENDSQNKVEQEEESSKAENASDVDLMEEELRRAMSEFEQKPEEENFQEDQISEEQETEPIQINAEPETVEEKPDENETEKAKEPVYLAIPVYTAEELIKKAKDAGEEPEIIEDSEAGVTILDYSDIL